MFATPRAPCCSHYPTSLDFLKASRPRGGQQYRQRVNPTEGGSTELSRAAKIARPIPPQCLRTEMNDVTV